MNTTPAQYATRARSRAYGLIALAFTVLAMPSRAQVVRDHKHEAVIVLVDDATVASLGATPFVPTSKGVLNTRWILRYPDGQQRNIVAIRRSVATSGLMFEGIRALQKLQSSRGDTPARAQLFSITDRIGESSDSEARAFYQRLLNAPSFPVRGLGMSQALVIKLKKEKTTE